MRNKSELFFRRYFNTLTVAPAEYWTRAYRSCTQPTELSILRLTTKKMKEQLTIVKNAPHWTNLPVLGIRDQAPLSFQIVHR